MEEELEVVEEGEEELEELEEGEPEEEEEPEEGEPEEKLEEVEELDGAGKSDRRAMEPVHAQSAERRRRAASTHHVVCQAKEPQASSGRDVPEVDGERVAQVLVAVQAVPFCSPSAARAEVNRGGRHDVAKERNPSKRRNALCPEAKLGSIFTCARRR